MYELTISSRSSNLVTKSLYKTCTEDREYRPIGASVVVDGKLLFSLSNNSESIRVDNLTFELKELSETIKTSTTTSAILQELENRVALLERVCPTATGQVCENHGI